MTFGDLKTSTSSTTSVPGSPSSGRSLKIVWQDEIRRLPFNAASGDLQSLKELCASCFVIKNLAGLIFTYEDSEGDTVTLSTIEELREIVESSPVTIKLNLQRKINKAKAQQAPQQQPTVSVPVKEAPQPVTIEVTQPEQPQPEKKNLKKEKKQQLKREIVHSKVVRIRWRTVAPETSVTTPDEKKKDKGCYVNVSLKGKVKFGACNQSPNGLWLMHELSSGDVIFAPLNASNCYLRVFADGRINLTQGGAGPRARWNLVKAQDQTALPLNAINESEKVQFASRFVPGLNFSVVQEFNRKNKPVLRPKGVNLATAASTSTTVVISEFTVEVQDPMASLVKFAKNVAAKKKAIKNVLKQKKQQEQEEVSTLGNEKKNKFNKEKKLADKNPNKVKNNNKDPNWASMTKQQRLEAKAARKLEKLEQKRLKMALKKKM